jgi:beta-glucosidase
VRWLAGWAAVDAAPGPATTTVAVEPRAFAHWAVSDDGRGSWQVEPGEFTAHVGTSVADTPLTAALTIP